MTRAHAPDCGTFFGGVCDCAVGALEEMVAYATKADERIAELTAEPAARTRDAALARCEREEKERKEANARVVRLQEALATTVKGRDEANARADAAEQRAVAALAQVEHFRRRLDAEAMRANEAVRVQREAVAKSVEHIKRLRADLDEANRLLAKAPHAGASGVTVDVEVRGDRYVASLAERVRASGDTAESALRYLASRLRATTSKTLELAAAAAARPPGARTSAASAEEGSGATPASAADTSAAPVGQTPEGWGAVQTGYCLDDQHDACPGSGIGALAGPCECACHDDAEAP